MIADGGDGKALIADGGDGRALIAWTWRATALLFVALGLGVVAPAATWRVPVVVSVLYFSAGIITFLWAYGIAVGRSRTEEVSVAGLFFMSEGAPTRVRRLMVGAFVAQTVAAVVAAALRPFTPIAFGLLAPMFGLGLVGLWSARHGVFRERFPSPRMGSSGPSIPTERTPMSGSARLSEDRDGETDAR